MSKNSRKNSRRKKYVIKNCKNCGDPFLAWSDKYDYCSDECAREWRNRKGAAIMNARRRKAERERNGTDLLGSER